MDIDRQADELRERMSQLRSELVGDVDQLSESAHAMADWRYYVRNFPLATTAVVAAAGYLIVPRKATQVSAVEAPQALSGNRIIKVPNRMKAGGFIDSLVSIAGAAALRMATAYITERIKTAVQQELHAGQEGEDLTATSHPR